MVDGGISGAYVTPLSLLDRRDGRIAKSHGRQQLSADHRHHLEPQRYAAAPHPSVQEARPTATPVGPWSSTCPTGLGTTSTHPPRGLRLPFRAHCRGHQGERSARGHRSSYRAITTSPCPVTPAIGPPPGRRTERWRRGSTPRRGSGWPCSGTRRGGSGCSPVRRLHPGLRRVASVKMCPRGCDGGDHISRRVARWWMGLPRCSREQHMDGCGYRHHHYRLARRGFSRRADLPHPGGSFSFPGHTPPGRIVR